VGNPLIGPRWLAIAAICSSLGAEYALAETSLPEVQVKPAEPAAAPAKPKPQPKKPVSARITPRPARVARSERRVAGSGGAQPGGAAAGEGGGNGGAGGGRAGAAGAPSIAQSFNATTQRILPPIGANVTSVSAAQIAAQPQGQDTPFEKTLLQTPGFSQDSAASGAVHLRNEHANVQYRIDGVLLPDGVSGFGQVLDSGFIGNLNVIDGALPAQYGLHTAGVVDITPKTSAFAGGGSVGLMGGSQQTISPSFEYGGTAGRTQYYVIGRGFWTGEGIENPTPSYNPIHDDSQQGKFFGYATTDLGDGGRLTLISGVSVGAYQIPNNPGQPIVFPVPGANPVDSSQLNENQYEKNVYNVLAWQKTFGTLDVQLSAFSRYSSLHFKPDEVGDLEFNGVSSDVLRTSFMNGIQADAAWRATSDHTVRFGFTGSGELAQANNLSVVFPTDAGGNVNGPPFAAPGQYDSKVGWLAGVYAQDEWRLTDKVTLNYGGRFDQMYGYVDANQFSPRASVTYKPMPDTTFHAGYARYFTPPELALSGPTNLAPFANTTQQPALAINDPVQPERSHVFDVGVDHTFFPGLTAGVDGYYKRATNLLDDGQFGAAYVLTAFNYASGYNYGVEGKVRYDHDNFSAYGNVAWGHQYATQVSSNQYLFDPDEYAYIANHYIPTDHSQTWTGSAGASYRWMGTLFSADMFFGSGLRSGFANLSTVPAYAQVNLGVSHDFKWASNEKPLTVRFDVVNVFDSIYEIRDGSGIGVFAPQYGPRRGFYFSFRQAI
jgi:outer membrane receptor protein involved in Fe transport